MATNNAMNAPSLDSEQSNQPHIVIAGHGRSGSNRLLDILDCHPNTFCRNEPNEIAGSAFLDLPNGFFPSGNADFVDQWQKAVERARFEVSGRDRLGTIPKNFHASPASRLLGRYILAKRRLRQNLGLFMPDWRRETWSASSGYADREKLAGATPVFKILLSQGWLLDALPHEPSLRVILNIREPRAFLRSWFYRYVDAVGRDQVHHDNMRTMTQILDHFGVDDPGISTFNDANLLKSELWRWRYVNEPLFVAFRDHPQFMVATYEEMDADLAAVSARCLAFCDLEVTPSISAEIAQLKNSLFPDKPRDLEADDIVDDIVSKVLTDSPLPEIWTS